jgi:hypothetical protein
MNSLKIGIHKSIEEAPKYNHPEYKSAELVSAEIVHGGTVNGRATVDLVFIDNNGQKYVTMVTARILDMLVKATGVQKNQDH